MKGFPASSLLTGAVFIVAVLATIGGALLAVFTQRIIRSVCGLAICCFGLAGLYYFLNSPFLALMEILIYVGAICVTIIFAVMLAEPDEAPRTESTGAFVFWGGAALAVGGAVLAGLVTVGLRHPWGAAPVRTSEGSLRDIGISLLSTYSLAFELISLVLLVAIIGALVVARYGRTKP
jgi:NADH-quinone oxidoreductase subunit J